MAQIKPSGVFQTIAAGVDLSVPIDPASFAWADDLVSRAVFEAAHEVVAKSFGVQARAVMWETVDAQPQERAWRGRTLIDIAKLTGSQRIAVGLSGLIAAEMTSDQSADSLSVIDRFDGSLLTEADADLLDGLSAPSPVELIDAVQLVRRHWPEIERRTLALVAEVVATAAQHLPARCQ